MNRKRHARKLGRDIRKKTGAPFVDCMRVAKLVTRGREWDVPEALLEARPFWCGWDCCGLEGHYLSGPKGEFRVR